VVRGAGYEEDFKVCAKGAKDPARGGYTQDCKTRFAFVVHIIVKRIYVLALVHPPPCRSLVNPAPGVLTAAATTALAQ
jgi:hypothetical protein